MTKLARRLRNARIDSGLTAPQLATKIGVSSTSIYFWETDHCRPRSQNIAALCKALRLPVREMREMADRR